MSIQTPDFITKACEVFGQMQSLQNVNEFRDLRDIDLLRDDVEFVERIVEKFRTAAISQIQRSLTEYGSIKKDILILSKSIQVLFNMRCLREECNRLVESVVEQFASKSLDFTARIPTIKQPAQADKSLNQFWELLDSALGDMSRVIGQISLMEAICSVSVDPASGLLYSTAWSGGGSPDELTDLAWAFLAKALSLHIHATCDAIPKIRKSLQAAEYLRSGIEKVAQESRNIRNEMYDILRSGSSTKASDIPKSTKKSFPVNAVVDRLRQLIR